METGERESDVGRVDTGEGVEADGETEVDGVSEEGGEKLVSRG